MAFKQLQEELRKLEKSAGEETSDALIAIMELRATKFELDLKDLKESVGQRFTTIQWMLTVGLSLLGILMVGLKLCLRIGSEGKQDAITQSVIV